jgi:Polysaccharide biosynthesis protein
MQYSKAQIRQALRRFLLGKAITGLLGLAFFVLVVRRLEPADFGVYTAMLALQGAVAVLATLGIEATLERYLPELRALGQPAVAGWVLFGGLLLRMLTLLFFSATAALTAGWWAPWLQLEAHLPAVYTAIVWLFLYGLLLTTCAVHEALLQQGSAQASMAVYTLLKMGLFLFAAPLLGQAGGVQSVLVAEAAGTALALVLALLLLRGHMPARGMPALQMVREVPLALRRRMGRFAAKNYGAQLIMLSYGPDALRLVATSTLGLAGTARFGVVHGIYEYIQRYLPAFLLMRLIRPVFVSRYAATRDFAALNALASMVLKINLFVLVPLLVFLVGAGDALIAAVSKGRYPDSGLLLVAYAALLVPMSNQWVVSIVANTTEQNDTQVKAASFAVVGILIGAPLAAGYGLPALILGAWISYLVYNVAAVRMLRRAGFPYRIDWVAVGKCGAAVAVGVSAVLGCVALASVWSLNAISVAVVGALCSLAVMLVLRLFSAAELGLLADAIRKRRS